jgi:hypothetical protein
MAEEEFEPKLVEISHEDKRKLISLLYLETMQAPPPEEWKGPGGTVSKIVEALKLDNSQRRRVERVIAETHHCLIHGEVYDAKRATHEGKLAIEDGSEIQQLVANYRERGLSYTETTMMINRWCLENDHGIVTTSAVVTCEEKMAKQVSIVEKRPQGKSNPDSTWAKCRYRWVTQLLIRLGYHDDSENPPEGAVNLDSLRDEDNVLPDYFNPYEMTPLDLCAIGWWDEVHKECFIGTFREGQNTQVRFARDENGNYDPKGTYREAKTAIQCK